MFFFFRSFFHLCYLDRSHWINFVSIKTIDFYFIVLIVFVLLRFSLKFISRCVHCFNILLIVIILYILVVVFTAFFI